MHWFGNLWVGAKAVLLKGTHPQWIFDAISEEKATIVFLLVPWAYDIMIALENNEIDLKNYELDQWRLMHMGAQPIPPSLDSKWKAVFPNHEFDVNYGLTEATGPGSVHLGIGNGHKVGAIGKPGYNWECQIVDENENALPSGEKGELRHSCGLSVCDRKTPRAQGRSRSLEDGALDRSNDMPLRAESA